MALGGGAPPPVPGACGGNGLEGDGTPTFGGLAGTAGLGLTSGGTTSDMSVTGKEWSIKIHLFYNRRCWYITRK